MRWMGAFNGWCLAAATAIVGHEHHISIVAIILISAGFGGWGFLIGYAAEARDA